MEKGQRGMKELETVCFDLFKVVLSAILDFETYGRVTFL